jgi:hypothetical protein
VYKIAMARYVLESGEVEILKEMVEASRGRRRVQGMLVLTDRRLVVQSAKPSPLRDWLFDMWAPAVRPLTKSLAPLDMTHQIDRDDFDAVESHGKTMLSFHSKGEGYGHVSFTVYSVTAFEVWQQRMQQWVAGTLPDAIHNDLAR